MAAVPAAEIVPAAAAAAMANNKLNYANNLPLCYLPKKLCCTQALPILGGSVCLSGEKMLMDILNKFSRYKIAEQEQNHYFFRRKERVLDKA